MTATSYSVIPMSRPASARVRGIPVVLASPGRLLGHRSTVHGQGR